jgi:hypothetical protein
MKILETWSGFLAAIRPFLGKAEPLEALQRAGFRLGGDVARAFGDCTPIPTLAPNAIEAMEAELGPVPATTLHIGAKQRAAPRSLGGFRAVAAADLAVLNDVLTELSKVRTIPNELSEERTQQVVTLADLENACTGVPADARLGKLAIPGPPVASASLITPRNMHFRIPFNLPVQPGPASLRGVVEVEQPLGFEVASLDSDPRIRLSPGAIQDLNLRLDVSPTSFLQPRSEDARRTLEQKFALALRRVLIFLFFDSGVLTIRASFAISSTFPNSRVEISQVGVVTLHKDSTDFVVAGVNVESNQETDPDLLVSAELPAAPNNVHAVVDERFASDALSAIIKSGDLADFINRAIRRHVPAIRLIDVIVNGGAITFDDNLLSVSVDCVVPAACPFGKDLGFTGRAFGVPSVAGGTLTIQGSDVDIDVDDGDAAVCLVLSSLTGPLSLMLNEAVLAVLDSLNPAGRNFEFPTYETSDPLPGSEKDLKIQLMRASVSPGTLTADGVASVIPDTLRAFVYLRLVTGVAPRFGVPLVGATVELLELDSPAPAGDDVVIPETGETDRFTDKFEISEVKTYQALPDRSLGSAVTDQSGFVRFASPLRSVGGIFTDVTTRTDIQTGTVISSESRTKEVTETKPDFAITVTDGDGIVLARRLLIARNNPGKHLGTLDHPFEVFVERVVVVRSK